MRAPDYGFYDEDEDEDLPIVVSPVVHVGTEWRLVVGLGRSVSAVDTTTFSTPVA